MTTYRSYEAAIEAGAKGTDRVREECENCEAGNKPWFAHVHDGVCFQCGGAGFSTVQVRTVKARERRHAKMLAEREAELAREAEVAIKQAQELVQWRTDHPELNAAITELANKGNRFALELKAQDRVPTDNQIAAILKIRDDINAETDVPEGRQVVTGKIVSHKLVDNHFSYHGGVTVKILVEDPRGFRIYGTAPAALLDARDIDELKGTEVEFTATLEGKEKGFGFFKRPTKARVI